MGKVRNKSGKNEVTLEEEEDSNSERSPGRFTIETTPYKKDLQLPKFKLN